MYLVSIKNAIIVASLSLNAVACVYIYNSNPKVTAQTTTVEKIEIVAATPQNDIVGYASIESVANPNTPVVKKKKKSTYIREVVIPVKEEQPIAIEGLNNSPNVITVNEPLEIAVSHSTIEEVSPELTSNEVKKEIIVTSSDLSTEPVVIEASQIVDSSDVEATQSETTLAAQLIQDIVESIQTESTEETESTLSVKLNLLDPTNIKVVWSDDSGKIFNVSNSVFPKGFQKINIKTEEIIPGTYTINLMNAASNQTLKSIRFVK